MNKSNYHRLPRRHSQRIAAAVLVLLLSLALPSVKCGAKEAGTVKEAAPAMQRYHAYQDRLEKIRRKSDIADNGFRIIENQVFPITTKPFGAVSFIPALDGQSGRLVIFLADSDGMIVYKSDQLETNHQNRGVSEQPNRGISAVSFQDLNGDGLTDIILITSCEKEAGAGEKPYKVGDVLFQDETGYYRDWRLSDRINRFGMNRSIRFIVSFVTEGYSTEFLYTATTLDELEEQGLSVVSEQCYWRQFEKLGKLLVVPGTYRMAEYTVFMIYLVNEQGYIVWSFQPMGDYENLYGLKGITCRDIDGDGMKDIVVLAAYSYDDRMGESVVESDYSVYYQRTGGFYADAEIKKQYRCGEEDTMDELVEKLRAFWGWGETR